MPRYFFDIHDGTDVLDTEGTELPDWQAAKVAAIRLAGAVISDDAQRHKLGENWCMEVKDESDLVLFRLDFYVSGSPAIAGALWSKEDADGA